MYGWDKITFKTITDNTEYKIKSETIATKVEENVSIPVLSISKWTEW